MALQRRSRFGFPTGAPQDSTHTWRAVPLTTGVQADQPWPAMLPGSSVSMTNFLPMEGGLRPRSRLSSLNTIRSLPSGIFKIGVRPSAQGLSSDVWLSSSTHHGLLTSNGSISVASFVSAFGFGTLSGSVNFVWHYALAYFSALDDNAIVAASGPNSGDTLQVLYRATGAGAPQFSYLTSAPRANGVCAFDNYLVAWNITQTTGNFVTRAQWCVRGSPSNWTSEGSGFEDLLDMRGEGKAIVPTTDGRFYLFTEFEIWYGVGATYPAQFHFYPYDKTVGCLTLNLIADTPLGIVFLGSDFHLRLIPKGGGGCQIIAPQLGSFLRLNSELNQFPWIAYDAVTGLLYVAIVIDGTSALHYCVVNLNTGEWGFVRFLGTSTSDQPRHGASVIMPGNTSVPGSENMMFSTSAGTVYSLNSLLATDSGSTVTATWRSAPIASDLAGNWKQLSDINLDFTATSKATLNVNTSVDGGNNYSAAGTLSLNSAPVSGRSNLNVYVGGAFPSIELTSTSTGFELHRLDVGMHIGGRR